MSHTGSLIPLHQHEERPKEFRRVINQLIKASVSGSVTLRDGQTTTTVENENISAERHPTLTAGPGTWTSTALRISAIAQGSFTITHSNEAATDRTVYWHL